MGVPIRHRMNRSVNLTTFTDELHTDVGSAAFVLSELVEATGHDYFSQQDLVIRTAAGGGGTLLVEGTHYDLSEENTTYSTLATNAAGSTKNIYKKIQITDAAYQSGALYFSGKYFTDYLDCTDLTNVTRKIDAVSTDRTIGDQPGYLFEAVTTGASAIFIDLPAAADNIDLELTFQKVDSGTGHIVLTPDGSDTINGMDFLLIIWQYKKITIKSNGTDEWYIIAGTLIGDTGLINRSDWTNVHIGAMNCPYDNLALNFRLGEIVTEAVSGVTGVVVYDDGSSNLVLWNMTGVGYFTDGRQITGGKSGATADVNIVAGDTKDTDYNFYHGWGMSMAKIEKHLYWSSDGTEANLIEIASVGSGADSCGYEFWSVDTSNFYIQTHNNGIGTITGAGVFSLLSNADDYYRIVAKLTL